jgi:DNA-binding phage protein
MSEPIIQLLQRRLREAGAKTWPGIAVATGVSAHQLRKIAYGDRTNPRLDTVQPLMEHFGILVGAATSESADQPKSAREAA